MRCIEDLYAVVGYNKDDDIYEKYGEYTVPYFALMKATEMTGLMKQHELNKVCSDGSVKTINWVEVYKNMDSEDKEKVWASYEPVWKEAGNADI